MTWLMPALNAGDAVRHWPVALLIAQSSQGLTARPVDARVALARRGVEEFRRPSHMRRAP
jgi:hypothetical protein